ncbi:MAG TPA: response regulator [Planctomycetota bacterium]|jgi:CheY-like chemotaxis protein
MAKILIVDDDPDIGEAMRLVLRAAGHETQEARTSTEGLAKVKSFAPDLVILDVMMESDTAGFHVAYQVHSQDPSSPYYAFRKTPILMLTAVGKEKGMAFSPESDAEFLPVDDFVEKPVKPEVLIKKVGKLLQKARES